MRKVFGCWPCTKGRWPPIGSISPVSNSAADFHPKVISTPTAPAYQPGQTVKFRGVIRDVKEGSYRVPQGAEAKYEVQIIDSAGRLLYEEPITLNKFGTFHSQFSLDLQVPVGSYQLVARRKEGPTYSSNFQVQEFKLEKLKLDLKTDRTVYFRGEQAELTIQAAYYWGQPAAEKLIRYALPDGRELVEKTDQEGKLNVTFDTSGMQPGTPLRFTASIEGENVAAAHLAMLAVEGFNIVVKPSRPLILSGEPVEVEIKTVTPDGKTGRSRADSHRAQTEQAQNESSAHRRSLDQNESATC